MVGRGVVLELADPRAVLARKRVVDAVRQRLQRPERVGRARAAEVHLERVGRPRAILLHRDEIEPGTADHPLTREPAADLQRLDRDLGRVLRVGGEAAAEVRLAMRPPEYLVVCGEDVDLAGRADA